MLESRFRYIFVFLLSALIMNAGAGIMVMHHCCMEGSVSAGCCGADCEQCAKTAHVFSDDDCEDHKCVASVYKEVLAKYVRERVSLPVALPCGELRALLAGGFPEARLREAFFSRFVRIPPPRERLFFLMTLIL